MLIISQALHSLEEYVFRLWEVFTPARIVSGLLSDNLTIGFLVANSVIVVFGFWCYFRPVRGAWKSARAIIWFWVLLELGNSIGHAYFAVERSGYFPGVVTAPLMFIISGLLFIKMLQNTSKVSN